MYRKISNQQTLLFCNEPVNTAGEAIEILYAVLIFLITYMTLSTNSCMTHGKGSEWLLAGKLRFDPQPEEEFLSSSPCANQL
jgi:hypothetical protein